jgi:hypothetical protein
MSITLLTEDQKFSIVLKEVQYQINRYPVTNRSPVPTNSGPIHTNRSPEHPNESPLPTNRIPVPAYKSKTY